MARRRNTTIAAGIVLGFGALAWLLASDASAAEPGVDGVFPPPPEPPEGPEPSLSEAPLPDFRPAGGQLPEFDRVKDTSTNPRAGMMYQVVQGDIFLGQNPRKSIAYRGLLSNAFIAAQWQGWSTAKSSEFADGVASDPNLRKDFYDLILCASINDALYGTWGYGSSNVPGPHGRAIRLLPQNADNLQRAAMKQPLIRNVRIGSFNNPGDGSGTAIESGLRKFPWLFMPKINANSLLLDRVIKPQEGGMYPGFEWSVQVNEDAVEGRQFGCRGGEIIL